MFYKKISMILNLVMKRLCVLLNGTMSFILMDVFK